MPAHVRYDTTIGATAYQTMHITTHMPRTPTPLRFLDTPTPDLLADAKAYEEAVNREAAAAERALTAAIDGDCDPENPIVARQFLLDHCDLARATLATAWARAALCDTVLSEFDAHSGNVQAPAAA